MENWYNTINLSGEELKKEKAAALKQEILILTIFKANPGVLITPSEMYSIFNLKYDLYPPITSIRRAMTGLTKEDKLIKTDERSEGLFKKPEHKWKLATENIYRKSERSAGDFASQLINSTQGSFF